MEAGSLLKDSRRPWEIFHGLPEGPFVTVCGVMGFADHFSAHSAEYARHRPGYPDKLFHALAGLAPRRALAWDCATGNGQAAVGLAPYFEKVVATDASRSQLEHARPHSKVEFRNEAAEQSSFSDHSVNLVVVAQAIHWLNLERFYPEVERVLCLGGVVAVWCYGLAKISPAIDPVVLHFYRDIVGPYWPPERALVDDGYRNLYFPFAAAAHGLGPFWMECAWSLPAFLSYLATWSATQRYIAACGSDPINEVREQLIREWGDSDRQRSVRWLLHLRVGRAEL